MLTSDQNQKMKAIRRLRRSKGEADAQLLIEEWKDLDGRTPLALRLRPGRYYAYAWRAGANEEIQGNEQKFDVAEGPHVIRVDVPRGD